MLKRRVRVKGFILVLSLTLIVSLILPSLTAQAHGWGKLKNQDKLLDKLFQRARELLQNQERLRFGDWQDAEWALGAIARLRGLGIISGYPGDVFKPQSPVSQVEALAMMVRAFGMEDEAQELAKKFSGFYTFSDEDDQEKGKGKAFGKDQSSDDDEDDDAMFITADGFKLPFVGKSARWGLGYVLLAVDQGWVSLSEIDPSRPATREWIAKVMVRALGYKEEAEAKMNVNLPFSDASAISKDSIGYVAQALELGLFRGYEDNTFRPLKPVTRAEMAAILDRFVQGEMPDETPYMVTGVVKEVGGGYITLTLSSGRSVTYRVSEDVLVMFAKEKAELQDVLVGDKVQVLTNGQGVVLLIEVKSRTDPGQGTLFTGKVISVATNQDDQVILTLSISSQEAKTILLAKDSRVFYGAIILSPKDILLHDRVKVEVKDGVGVRVDILDREDDTIVSGEVRGTISGITLSGDKVTLSIKDARGKTQTVTLRYDCRIVWGTEVLDVQDLALGDQIIAYLENRLAYRVVITSKTDSLGQYALGTVYEIYLSSTGTTLKIRDENAKVYTYRLSSNVRVVYQNQIVGPESIGWGDTVRLGISGDVVTEVVITARYQGPKDEITGVVTGVTTDADGNFITVQPESGQARKISVSDSTKVTSGTSVLTWADIRIRDRVQIRVKDGNALEVKILSRNADMPFGDLGGKIVAMNQSLNETVIVLEEQGLQYTVRLSSQVKITYGETQMGRYDLRIGDVVRCRLENQVCVELRVVSRGPSSS